MALGELADKREEVLNSLATAVEISNHVFCGRFAQHDHMAIGEKAAEALEKLEAANDAVFRVLLSVLKDVNNEYR
jgi:hypothetical protein